MPNGTYGGVRGTETKVGQKTFVSRPTRFIKELNDGIYKVLNYKVRFADGFCISLLGWSVK